MTQVLLGAERSISGSVDAPALAGVGSVHTPTSAILDPASVDGLGSTERAIAIGFMGCVARWGIAKTTIEDIARESGVSRATVYRYFPGGKTSIRTTAWRLDVAEFIGLAAERIAGAATLEDALVGGMHSVSTHFTAHPALAYLRQYEPAEFEQLVSFDSLDTILAASGTAMAPLLGRFLDDELAFDVALWIARLLVSYLSEPATYLDLSSEGDVRRLVRTFVLPGIEALVSDDMVARSEKTSNQTETSSHGDPTHLGDDNVHS